MTANAVLQLSLYCVLLVVVAKPLGGYMARVYQGDARTAQKVIGPLERIVYRVLRVDAKEEMTWKTYALAAMFFNVNTRDDLRRAERIARELDDA